MVKFKEGDKVRVKEASKVKLVTDCNTGSDNGTKLEYLILRQYNDVGPLSWFAYDKNDDNFDRCSDHDMTEDDIELYDKPINSNKNIFMTIIEKFKSAMMKEPLKSFVKFGITDEKGTLTTDGQALFIQHMFEQNQASFVKEVVDVLKAEEEKDSK